MTNTNTENTENTENADDYNGWANRETWAIALHVSNDRDWADYWHDVAVDAIADALRFAERADGVRRPSDLDQWAVAVLRRAARIVGDRLDTWTGEQRDSVIYGEPDHGDVTDPRARSMTADVGSFWRADWFELGASVIQSALDDPGTVETLFADGIAMFVTEPGFKLGYLGERSHGSYWGPVRRFATVVR